MNRLTASYGESRHQFIRKALTWAEANFDRYCFLNTNDFSGGWSSGTILAAGITSELQLNTESILDNVDAYIAGGDQAVYGYFTFECLGSPNPLIAYDAHVSFPKAWLFRPQIEIEFKQNEAVLSSKDSPSRLQAALASLNAQTPTMDATYLPLLGASETKSMYLSKVRAIQEHVARGDVYELTFCQEFSGNGLLNPVAAYLQLTQASPSPLSTFLRHRNKYVISASMERFLQKKGNKLSSQPIKGTSPRSVDSLADFKSKLQLQNSLKERAENTMIVDLVRNDMARIASKGTVKVEELCGLYSYAHVHQLVSTVSAEVGAESKFSDFLSALFPMGSMTGAPKVKALELIKKFEGRSRNLFSGTIGRISAEGNFDFSVLIRSLFYDATNQIVSLSTGSAITVLSAPEDEYEECLLKAKSITLPFLTEYFLDAR